MNAKLLVLAVCWLLARVSPRQSHRVMDWATRMLPETRWYIGE